MALQCEHWISSEEYLEIDQASLDVKYEYEDGHMYAMSGGTVEHGQIAINMIRALANHFGQGPCRAFSSDTKSLLGNLSEAALVQSQNPVSE